MVSRYPIIAWGEWNDTLVSDRDFVWARIDIPGTIDLYVISVHLLTSSSGNRNSEAQQIVNTYMPTLNIPADAYVCIAGDFNTDSRSEACISTFSSKFVTASPYPAGQDGNLNTNAGRSKPYDWVVVNSNLHALRSATTYGSFSYANGLVFDTRDFTQAQLNSAFSPCLVADSGATNMQHMAVVRTFNIPAGGTVSNGDSVTVSTTDRAPGTANSSTVVPMLSVTLTASANEWDAQTVSVNQVGTIPDANVSARAILDANNNGVIDSGETVLATSPFSSGAASLFLSPPPRATPGNPIRLLLAASIGSGAATGATVQFRLNANGIAHGSTGGTDLDPAFAAVLSGTTTVSTPPPFVGPPVVINKYFNFGTAASGDVVELLVVKDGLDMRGMILKDFSSSMASDGGGKYTFSTNALWSNLRAGTLIVLPNNNSANDTTTGGSDFTLDVGLGNATYFTNSGGTFDIGATEMVMIKSAGSGAAGVTGSIHALASGTAGAQYTAAPTPKLRAATSTGTGQYCYADNSNASPASVSVLSNYTDGTGTATGGATGLTLGAANNANNQAFITFLRGPAADPATNVSAAGCRISWSALPTAVDYQVDVATDAAFTSLVTGYNARSSGGNAFLDLIDIGLGTFYYRARGVNPETTVSGVAGTNNVVLTTSVSAWDAY